MLRRPRGWAILVGVALTVAAWFTISQEEATASSRLTLVGWLVLLAVGALVVTLMSRLRYFWCRTCNRAWSLRDVAVNGVMTAPYSCPVCSLPSGEPSEGLVTWRIARQAHPEFPSKPAPGEIYR
jgi:hypothetical protein